MYELVSIKPFGNMTTQQQFHQICRYSLVPMQTNFVINFKISLEMRRLQMAEYARRLLAAAPIRDLVGYLIEIKSKNVQNHKMNTA